MREKEIKMVNKLIENTQNYKLVWEEAVRKKATLLDTYFTTIPENDVNITIGIEQDFTSSNSVAVLTMWKKDENKKRKIFGDVLCKIKEEIKDTSDSVLYKLYEAAKDSANTATNAEIDNVYSTIFNM